MRKCAKLVNLGLILWIFVKFLISPGPVAAQDTTSALSDALLIREQNEVARIKALVEEGTLPRSRLDEEEARLADAKDQAVLSQTLYGQLRLQDMTPAQAQDMVAAAQRRVDRQSVIVLDRQNLLDQGILARSEFTSYQDELDSRKRVLELAKSRATLVDELRQMAEQEQRFEHAAQSAAAKDVMIRYEGNGAFTLADLPTISSEFEKRFHHPLPISALGQTLLHQSMGLDHRNRVDVALNPDLAEGVWLRQLLERLHVPYLAFRGALAGAATAPHIHIGTGSTRLKLALR
jgi:hypothetical protein